MSITVRHIISAVAGAALVASVLILVHDPREEASAVEVSEGAVDRGRYLAIAGNCATCHTVDNGAYLAGGVAFPTTFGTIYSTNITPDTQTGIGTWSFTDFRNAMRHGMRPDGTRLYPAFPYTAYTKMTDEDLAALFAYLRQVPATERAASENQLRFPFSVRSLLAFWNVLYHDPGAYQADPTRSQHWNRGAYLVQALAHCSACHSPRSVLGGESSSRALSGGEYLDQIPGGNYKSWSAPNLTPSERGLGLWNHSDLADYLGMGQNAFLESYGPMNEVIMNSTRHLAASDIDAMATYLLSHTPQDPRPAVAADEVTLGRGRTVYNLHCGTCHLPTGLGDPEMAPRLARGSLVVAAQNPASMINTILYGPEVPDNSTRWRTPMEEFQYLLDDDEVAAVATFVRQSWGNQAETVTADLVARQR